MSFTLECEQEVDGRWIAEVPMLPGVLSYGDSAVDAMSKAEILALPVISDRLENSELEPVSISFSLPVTA
jgi:predicted RNase H-like HicB family nuclease